jgi:protein arginine kinase activator
MQCDVCQTKEATVFLTQIVDGKMQKVNLCEGCSKEKGVNDPTGFALADLLLGLGASEEIEKSPAAQKCPICGFTQADFKKTGRLGCSNCYTVFADGIAPMLKNMHKGTQHTGKTPTAFHKIREHDEKIKALQENLSKAIDAEEFELAANLRDQIRQVEAELAS